MVRTLPKDFTPETVTNQVFASLSPKLRAKIQQNACNLSRESGENHLHKIADRITNVGK